MGGDKVFRLLRTQVKIREWSWRIQETYTCWFRPELTTQDTKRARTNCQQLFLCIGYLSLQKSLE